LQVTAGKEGKKGGSYSRSSRCVVFPVVAREPTRRSGGDRWSKRVAIVPETHKIPARFPSPSN